MTRGPDWIYRQSAVVPYLRSDGEVYVVLVTSLRSRRWGIPKGIVEPGLSPADSATKEALEEAGVIGAPGDSSFCEYRYDKWDGTCTVQVFPLRVTEVLADWEEAGLRDRCVVPLATAVTMVKPALVDVLHQFDHYLREQPD